MSDDDAGLDMGDLLRQAMAMQERLMAAHEEAQAATAEGQAGGGMVRVTMTGAGEVTAVRIAPEAIDPDDIGFLEDLVLAAIHDASAKASELQAKALGSVGGLGELGLGGFGAATDPDGPG